MSVTPGARGRTSFHKRTMIGPSYCLILQTSKLRSREVNDWVSNTHLGPESYSESHSGFFTPHFRGGAGVDLLPFSVWLGWGLAGHGAG